VKIDRHGICHEGGSILSVIKIIEGCWD